MTRSTRRPAPGIEDLQAVHRFAAKERGVKKPVAVTKAQIEENPDARHPVARPHPKTGRKALYVRKGECVGIDGMDESEALALIDRLSDLIVEDRFIYRHRWAVGDLLMWDNPAVQHVAIRDYEWPPTPLHVAHDGQVAGLRATRRRALPEGRCGWTGTLWPPVRWRVGRPLSRVEPVTWPRATQ